MIIKRVFKKIVLSKTNVHNISRVIKHIFHWYLETCNMSINGMN